MDTEMPHVSASNPYLAPRVSDIAKHLAHDPRNLDVTVRADLSGDVHLAGDNERLDRDAPGRILRQDRVEHGVRNLVCDLIRVTFGDTLRSEQFFDS